MIGAVCSIVWLAIAALGIAFLIYLLWPVNLKEHWRPVDPPRYRVNQFKTPVPIYAAEYRETDPHGNERWTNCCPNYPYPEITLAAEAFGLCKIFRTPEEAEAMIEWHRGGTGHEVQ